MDPTKALAKAARDKIDAADFAGPNRTFPCDTRAHVRAAARLYGHAANPNAGDDMLPELAEAISNLHAPFTFRDEESVTSFLHSNPSLVPILLDAGQNIAERFEDRPPLALEVVSDPEEPECDRLFLFIQTHLPADLAIKRLHQLDEEWWLDITSDADDKMTIDIERQSDDDVLMG